MLYFEAEFPQNTPSKELYELLKPYGLHVTEMIFITFAYGDLELKDMEKVVNVCYCFNVSTFHITNKGDG